MLEGMKRPQEYFPARTATTKFEDAPGFYFPKVWWACDGRNDRSDICGYTISMCLQYINNSPDPSFEDAIQHDFDHLPIKR